MITEKLVTYYVSSDGCEFCTREEAEQYERVGPLAMAIDNADIDWRDGAVEALALWLLDHYEITPRN